MKGYTVDIKDSVLTNVYRRTANAAQQRGDGIRVATADNEGMLNQFLASGLRIVEAALGRYGNGGMNYSMPENWNYASDIDERVNKFLEDYITACWFGLATQVELPTLELMSILNKRSKPI